MATLKTPKEAKLNITSDFVLPLFGKSLMKFTPFLVNAFIKDDSGYIPKEGEINIFILLKFTPKQDYTSIENWLQSHTQYRGQYDLIKGNYTMYILELPLEFVEDYKKILVGRYSSLSRKAKKLILIDRSARSAMPHILERSPQLKEYWEERVGIKNLPNHLDVWPVMEEKEEIFNKEKFEEEYGFDNVFIKQE